MLNHFHKDTYIDTKNGKKKISDLAGQTFTGFDKSGKEITLQVVKDKSDKMYQYLFCSILHHQYFTVFASRDTLWLYDNGCHDYGFVDSWMKSSGEWQSEPFYLEHISVKPFFVPTETYTLKGMKNKGARLSSGLIVMENKPKPKRNIDRFTHEQLMEIFNNVKQFASII